MGGYGEDMGANGGGMGHTGSVGSRVWAQRDVGCRCVPPCPPKMSLSPPHSVPHSRPRPGQSLDPHLEFRLPELHTPPKPYGDPEADPKTDPQVGAAPRIGDAPFQGGDAPPQGGDAFHLGDAPRVGGDSYRVEGGTPRTGGGASGLWGATGGAKGAASWGGDGAMGIWGGSLWGGDGARGTWEGG